MSRDVAIRTGTRARILTAASELFSRHGYSATGLKAVLAASDAPFGSLYHFFPGGKEELGVAVLVAGGATYRELVESIFTPGADVAQATADFFEGAAAVVEATDFTDACPIATIALEVASSSEAMRSAAANAFESWLSVLTDRFTTAGISATHATDLATQFFCSIEGAFLLSRTTRSADPIRVVGRAATAAVQAALARES
jgi:TetR/AcrR family transcriptional regulator, lmrAB and yxaGH operons repressor